MTKLVSYADVMAQIIPEARTTLTAKDAAFYALSVGLGQDPLDTRQLQYVAPAHDLNAPGAEIALVPSIALVLAYPGFWLGQNRVGIDARQVIHMQQSLKWGGTATAPLGLVGRTSVENLYNRPDSRGLVLVSRRDVLSENGDLLVTLRQKHLLRGNSCPEAPVLDDAVDAGMSDMAEARQVYLATRPEQALYYRLNGDMNPLHSSPEAASAAGFSRPILHGMCTFGVLTHGILMLSGYEGDRIRSIEMRLKAPVLPGDTLELSLNSAGRFTGRAIERNVQVVDQGVVEFSPQNGLPNAIVSKCPALSGVNGSGPA